MTQTAEQTISYDEFIAFGAAPDNAERRYEYINGEVIEVSPGRTYVSQIGVMIAYYVLLYCSAEGLPRSVSGSDGTFVIDGHVVAPDFAWKRTPMSMDYPDPVPPELAVEVVSPTDTARHVAAKRAIYVAAGILYWEVYPEVQRIEVYAPGQPFRTLGGSDTLDGGAVLPGFALPLPTLFTT